MMYGLIGTMKAQHGQRAALVDHLLKAADFLRGLDGCYLYVVHTAADDPDTIWVTEAWRSQDDHRGSLAYEEVKTMIAAARPLIAEMGGGFEVVPIGGKGLPEREG